MTLPMEENLQRLGSSIGRLSRTYDDPASIQQKMEFVHRKGLGGAFAWELSDYLADGDLANAIYSGLRDFDNY